MELRLTGEEDAGETWERQGRVCCQGGVSPQPACCFHFVLEIGEVFARLGVEIGGDSLEVAGNPLFLDKSCEKRGGRRGTTARRGRRFPHRL